MDFSGLTDAEFIFLMLIVFQVKQLIGDFALQSDWMVEGKKKPGFAFVYPLTVHVVIHAVMTLTILLVVNKALWALAFIDFATHFVMDRIKSSPGFLGRFTDTSKRSYWVPFGVDQMIHHLTHYFIIWQLFAHR